MINLCFDPKFMQLGTSQLQELYSLSQLPTHVHTQLSWKVKWWLCPCLSHPHDWGLCSVLLHFCMHLSFDFDNQKLWIHKGFKLFIEYILHTMSRQNSFQTEKRLVKTHQCNVQTQLYNNFHPVVYCNFCADHLFSFNNRYYLLFKAHF